MGVALTLLPIRFWRKYQLTCQALLADSGNYLSTHCREHEYEHEYEHEHERKTLAPPRASWFPAGMEPAFPFPDSRAHFAPVPRAPSMETDMNFTFTHAETLTREIRAYFKDDSAHLGEVDMSYSAKADMPCIYVEFFANGQRHLADVGTRADGSVDWIY